MRKADNPKENARNQRIQVFARCRPINNFEKKQGSPSAVEVHPERKEIKVKDDKMINKSFAFDKVFGPETEQISVYKSVVEPLIREVLMGYNCTVFAYGQTGTGKTFTMEGERSSAECSWEEDPGAGIIPRSLHQLFEELTKEENVEFSVHVSFLELYNEELFDLLSRNDMARLRLFEDSARKGSVVIQGLEEIKVNSKDEVYVILEQGTARRQKAATLLNATSSRSHTVFSVTVHIKENTTDGEELLKTGKLNLVDLAGSENIGRSGASQKTAREAGNINQSLLTLGRVITALVEKAPHIPYRESKLTRLLQDSLGGHTKTSIIATVSPALCNIDETISTLDYAQRAKCITIKPEINQKMTKKALIKQYTEEIERLRKDLVAARSQTGFYVDQENYNNMQQELNMKADKVTELEDKIEAMTAKMQQIEELFVVTQEKLKETTDVLQKTSKKFEATVVQLSDTKQKLTSTQTILQETIIDRDEKEYITEVQSETEKQLLEQAQTLLHVAEESSSDVSALHRKIDRKNSVEQNNEKQSQEFQHQFRRALSKLDEVITSLASNQMDVLNSLQQDVGNTLNLWSSHVTAMLSSLIDFSKLHEQQMNSTSVLLQSNIDARSGFSHKMKDMKKQHMEEFLDLQKNSFDSMYLLHDALIMQHMSLVNQLQSKHKDLVHKLEMQKQIVSNSVSVQKKCISELRQTIQEFCKTQVSTVGSLRAHKASVLEIEDVFHVKFSELMKNFMNVIEDRKQKVHSTLAQFDPCIEELNSNCQSAAEKTESQLNQLDGIQNALQNEVVDHLSELKLQHEASVEEKVQILNTSRNHVEELKQKLMHYSHQCQGKLEGDLALVIETCNKEEEKVCAARDTHQKEADEQKKELCLLRASKEKLIYDDDKNINTVLGGMDGAISHCTHQLSSSSETLREKLHERDHEVEKFVTERLMKDVPTGTTPQRKEYVFPKRLVRLVPPQEIGEQFRAQLKSECVAAAKESLNSSFNESPETKTAKEGAKVSDNEPTETAEGSLSGDSCSESDSSVSSFSDASSKSCRNKENNPVGCIVSNIPKRMPQRKKRKQVRKKEERDGQFLIPLPVKKLPLHLSKEENGLEN